MCPERRRCGAPGVATGSRDTLAVVDAGSPTLTARETLSVVPLVTTRVLDAPLTYEAGVEPLPVGALVRAPLGPRTVRGVVVASGPAPADAPAKLRPVEDTGVRVPPDLVALALDLADRYGTTPGRTLALVLPPDAAPRLALWAEREPDAVARGARQRAVLDALRSGPLPLAALRAATGAGADVVRRLAEAGALRVYEPSPPEELQVGTGPPLTTAQTAAVARIAEAMDAAEALLLHGVTGAGKTEVFLHAIARCLEAGRGAIVLVPEIALAPQTAGRISGALRRPGGGAALGAGPGRARGRAPAHPARRGAGGGRAALGDLRTARRDRPDRRRRGARRRLQAGLRPALRRAGGGAAARPRARRRRASTRRRRRAPSPGTPLERVSLPERVGGRLPPVDVVDLLRDGGYPLSRPLSDGLAAIERDGGRAVLLLNRRGEAPALHCRGCGVDLHAAATATSR